MGTLSQKDQNSRTAHVLSVPAHHPRPTAWAGHRILLMTLPRSPSHPGPTLPHPEQPGLAKRPDLVKC
jgi:hypothetical protein